MRFQDGKIPLPFPLYLDFGETGEAERQSEVHCGASSVVKQIR